MTKVKSERTPTRAARKRARTRGSAGRRERRVRGWRRAETRRARCPRRAAFAVDRAHVQRCEAKREGRGKRPETKTTEANPNANVQGALDLRSTGGIVVVADDALAIEDRLVARTVEKRAKVTSEPEATLDDDDDVIIVIDDDDEPAEVVASRSRGRTAVARVRRRGRAGRAR